MLHASSITLSCVTCSSSRPLIRVRNCPPTISFITLLKVWKRGLSTMLSRLRSDWCSVGRMPHRSTFEPSSLAAVRASRTRAPISRSIWPRQSSARARGARFASRLNVASSGVNCSPRRASTRGALGQGAQPSSTRNISSSAPMRRTPDSMRPSSIIRSSACTSSSRAWTKERSSADSAGLTSCSPMRRGQLYPRHSPSRHDDWHPAGHPGGAPPRIEVWRARCVARARR